MSVYSQWSSRFWWKRQWLMSQLGQGEELGLLGPCGPVAGGWAELGKRELGL
jgi:hypothetical protein